MADNFNLRQFLTENKLTKNAQILKEEVSFNGKPVDTRSIEIDGIDMNDYPDFVDAYITYAEYEDGTPLTDEELHDFEAENYGLVGELIHDRQLYLEGKKEKTQEERVEEANYSDSYESAAAKKVYAQLQSIPRKDLDAAIAKAEEETGTKVSKSERNTLDTQKFYMDRNDWAMERESVQNKKPVMEAKLTAKERKLVKLVENALGIQKEVADQYGYDPDNEEWEPEDDYPGQTRYVSRRDIEEGDEMANEKVLPKYENIEKLMQEIEHGTNEAAYKHKMAKMKEVAEMLEAKVGSLEEGEGADFVDAKKVKQMKKDIMTLRKQAEKLEKEYDKKFAKKQDKKEALKESKLLTKQITNKMENFNLKKFLVENKMTTNSRMLKENADMGEKMQFFMEFMGQHAAGMPEEEILEMLEGSYDIPEDVDMQILKRATSELDLVINDIYTAVFESDNY